METGGVMQSRVPVRPGPACLHPVPGLQESMAVPHRALAESVSLPLSSS